MKPFNILEELNFLDEHTKLELESDEFLRPL